MDVQAQTHGLEVALEAAMHLHDRLLEAIERVSEAAESRMLPTDVIDPNGDSRFSDSHDLLTESEQLQSIQRALEDMQKEMRSLIELQDMHEKDMEQHLEILDSARQAVVSRADEYRSGAGGHNSRRYYHLVQDVFHFAANGAADADTRDDEGDDSYIYPGSRDTGTLSYADAGQRKGHQRGLVDVASPSVAGDTHSKYISEHSPDSVLPGFGMDKGKKPTARRSLLSEVHESERPQWILRDGHWVPGDPDSFQGPPRRRQGSAVQMVKSTFLASFRVTRSTYKTIVNAPGNIVRGATAVVTFPFKAAVRARDASVTAAGAVGSTVIGLAPAVCLFTASVALSKILKHQQSRKRKQLQDMQKMGGWASFRPGKKTAKQSATSGSKVYPQLTFHEYTVQSPATRTDVSRPPPSMPTRRTEGSTEPRPPPQMTAAPSPATPPDPFLYRLAPPVTLGQG
eukprot:scaffold1658_cov393-Prasinococcus_capsulatus_cf.AAC.19